MANGDDQVQVQMPDGRILTGPRSGLPTALRMGAKLYTPKKASQSTASKIDVGMQQGVAKSLGIKLRDPEHPETTTFKDIGKQVGSNLYKAGKESLKKYGPLAPFDMIASGIEGTASSLESGGKTLYKGIKSGDAKTAASGGGEMLGSLGQLLAGAEGEKVGTAVRAEAPVEIEQRATGGAKNVLASVFNEGATREKMQKLQDYDALTTKAKISRLDKSVEADAGKLMTDTSKSVDQKFPQGSTDLSQTAKVIKDGLGEKVKAKTIRAKLPSSLSKVIDESQGGSGAKVSGRLSNSELKAAMAMKNSGLAGEDLKSALVNLGYAPKQVEGIMSAIEGTETQSALSSFEKMKQLRTELSKELFSGVSEKYPGTIRRVMYDAWKDMTAQLDSAAAKAGVSEEWARGKQKWANYMTDFYGKYERGKYSQSPIDKVLKGQNASEIMDPLSGSSAQQARDILRKYSKFGVNPEEIAKDVRRYGTNQKVMRFASPSKWDIIIGGMALYRPEWGIPAFIARYGLPRLAESIIARRADTIPSARPSIPAIPEEQIIPSGIFSGPVSSGATTEQQ